MIGEGQGHFRLRTTDGPGTVGPVGGVVVGGEGPEMLASDAMKRRQISAAISRYDAADGSVVLERSTDFTTLVWSTSLPPSAIVDLFRPIVDSAEPAGTSLLRVAMNGFSERMTGRSEVESGLDDIMAEPDSASLFRLEMQIQGIGDVALSFSTALPGVHAGAALSMSAPDVDHHCLRKVYEDSVPVDLPVFDELAAVSHQAFA